MVSVDGQPVPPNPLGRFDPVDVTINNAGPIEIQPEAENTPLGTTVTVTIVNETDGLIVDVSSPLAGASDALSTATVTMSIPAGFSRIFAHAEWAP